MTAEQLYAIVKDLPRELWPDDLEYGVRAIGDTAVWHFRSDLSGWLFAKHAAALFVAKLVEWLAVYHVDGICVDNDCGEWVIQTHGITLHTVGKAPTLLEALVAAWKATQ